MQPNDYIKSPLERFKVLLVSCSMLFPLTSCNPTTQSPMSTTSSEFLKANAQFYDALNQMLTGDSTGIHAIWSKSPDATYLGPYGEKMIGSTTILKAFDEVTKLELGGHIQCEIIHSFMEGSMGYVMCEEIGENTDSEGNTFPVSHRATNIFRLENDGWKLMHHHTDISIQLEEAREN